jgi:hypothetical protein
MTATISADPLTASVFLFPDHQDTGHALAEALDRHDVLRTREIAPRFMTQIMREAAEHQVGVVADGLLNLDLGDLVLAGWRKQERLAAAAERTAANPGSSELVELATHRITSIHRPYVELLLNDTHLTYVSFEFDLEFVVTALAVTVRHGRIVSLHAGDCDVSATLAAEGVQLISRKERLPLSRIVRWPLLLRSGRDPEPFRYGAESPAAPPLPQPSGGGLVQFPHRQRRKRTPPGTPAD